VATGSAPRSRGRARRPACRRSRRTISGTAGSHSSTSVECRRRGSASTSGSTPRRHREHLLACALRRDGTRLRTDAQV
jgi:hypothetical protein